MTEAILVSGILLMLPIVWASFGEAICEQAGVLNIGVEGGMLAGAFGSAVVLREFGGPWLALWASIPLGAAVGCVLGWFYVIRGTDQIVTGILFNFLMLGLTTVLYEKYLTGVAQSAGVFDPVAIPLLSDIPLIGPALFDQNVIVYLATLAAPLLFLLMRRTWFGLHARAVGERPEAADVSGVGVSGVRFAAVVFACVLSSIGGATLVVTQSGQFTIGITSGQGFIALAVVVLARWNPLLVLPAAAVFGMTQAFQFQAQSAGFASSVPFEAWALLPYVATIAVVVASKRAQYPAGCGIHYPSPAGHRGLTQQLLEPLRRVAPARFS